MTRSAADPVQDVLSRLPDAKPAGDRESIDLLQEWMSGGVTSGGGRGVQAMKGRNRRRSSLPVRHPLPVERLAAVAERIRLGLAGSAFTVSTCNLRDMGIGVTIEDERRFRRVLVWWDVIAPPAPAWSVVESSAVVVGRQDRIADDARVAELAVAVWLGRVKLLRAE